MPSISEYSSALFLITALLGVPGVADAQCPPGERYAADIVEPGSTPTPRKTDIFSVERSNRTMKFFNGGVRLCTGDRVIAQDLEVSLVLDWRREPIRIRPRSHFMIPGKRRVIFDLLADAAPVFFEREVSSSGTAGTLGSGSRGPSGNEEMRFAIAGLPGGDARLTALPTLFSLPISRKRTSRLDVVIVDPEGHAHEMTAPENDDGAPQFEDLPKIPGEWRIFAESGVERLSGKFILETANTWPGQRGTEEDILIWICEDPARNGLQGVHELREVNSGVVSPFAKSILEFWYTPGSSSFCAASPG